MAPRSGRSPVLSERGTVCPPRSCTQSQTLSVSSGRRRQGEREEEEEEEEGRQSICVQPVTSSWSHLFVDDKGDGDGHERKPATSEITWVGMKGV